MILGWRKSGYVIQKKMDAWIGKGFSDGKFI